MPLNLQTSDGDFLPFIKYNAKAGRWYIRQEGVDGDVEIVNPVLAFDFENIKTGWLFYMEGMGPEKVWDPSPDTAAPKPPGTKKFKRGFEVVVHGAAQGIGVREFSSTAGSMIGPVLEMYAAYEAGRAANLGKVPIFACTGVKSIPCAHGTNYSPIFKLQTWTERSRIPFDADRAPPPRNGQSTQQFWTWEQALADGARVGLNRDSFINKLKEQGHKSINMERDTATFKAMIESLSAPPGDQSFEQPDPVHGDIPFTWLLPLGLAFASMLV